MFPQRHVSFVLIAIIAVLALPLAAQRIISTISGFQAPSGVAIDSVTNRIYVADSSRFVAVIDGTTNQLIQTVNVGHIPRRPVVNSVTNKIYVPNGGDNTVTVIDGLSFSTTTVNVGVGPAAAAVNPVTNKIYVANSDDNTVTVINGATLGTTTIPVDEGPLAVAVNPTTNKIYVGNQRFINGSSVTVIDGATNHTTTIPLASGAYFYSGEKSLLVDSATDQIFALASYGLYQLDGATNDVSLVQWPFYYSCVQYIALNPVTHHVYGPDLCSDTVGDFDAINNVMISLSDSFLSNVYVSVDSTRNRVYLSDPYANVVSVLDRQIGTQTVFYADAAVGDLATNPSTNATYLTTDSGTVDVVAGASAMQFVAAQPCRVLDTRNSGGPIVGGTVLDVDVLASGCQVSAAAASYSLNVTLVPAGSSVGYLTIWPANQFRPTISTMNSVDGRTKANAAVVSAGNFGKVSVYVSDTTDVVIDIDGYFVPNNGSTLAFYPLPLPCRVIDTRGGTGDLQGPYLSGGQERDFPVLESSCVPVNANPKAYSFNVTAVPHHGVALRYLTVWPEGQAKPLVSTLNDPTATIVADAALVSSGQDGGIAVYPSDDTDLVVDMNGYFAAPGPGGLSLYSSSPCRVLDTRQQQGAFSGELTVPVLNSGCALPDTAKAYVLNATVVPQGPLGYLTLYPDNQDQPLASTLNAVDGRVTSNMAIVPSENGSIDAYASSLTQLILDVSSYFAP